MRKPPLAGVFSGDRQNRKIQIDFIQPFEMDIRYFGQCP
jgi:hypothetical protein